MQRFILPACATIVATLSVPVQASTTSHALTVAGRAQGGVGPFGCATSGPQPQVRKFFSAAVGIPTEGHAGCNLSGSIDDHSGAGATAAASSASRAFNNGTANLQATAHAGYDGIGTQAGGTFSGYTDGFSYHAAEGAAFVNDALTFTGGSGAGTVTFGFAIDGSMHAYGNTEAFTELNYQVGSGPIYSAFAAKLSYGTGSVRAFDTPDFSGFTNTGTTIDGSATVYTYAIPITFGQSLDLTYALFSAAYPGPNGGDAASAFASTAKLSSIKVTNAAGTTVNFAATSASGTLYDALGAHVTTVGDVPEPATWATMVLGFTLVGGTLRRRAGGAGGHLAGARRQS